MNLLHYHQLYSPQFQQNRIVRVLLPKDYATSQRQYSVLYMQDGQNLFDAKTAAFRDWQLPNRMSKIALKHQVIIVGIDNGGLNRVNEYSPYPRGKHGGQGDRYIQFLIETVKVFIDTHYRTLPFRENTGIAGSSLGGLLSLYAGLKYGQYFGKVATFSPSLWFNPKVLDLAAKAAWKSQIYAVASKTEMQSMSKTMQNLYFSLKNNQYNDEQIRIIIRDRGRHNEVFWRKEFKGMLEWLF